MTMKVYGYARVSTDDQKLDRQIKELLDAGVDERDILTDKQSGKDFNRPSYNTLVNSLLRKGDLLVVYSIDRLGRNYKEIQEQWQHITKNIGANIKVLDMPLLDTSANGNSLDSTFIADLVLQILSYVAQKERENIKVRQEQGIAAAKAKGVHCGRPKAQYPDNWEVYYTKWKNGEITATKAIQELNLTRNTFYNLSKRYEDKQTQPQE